jgi:hypothetical protein
MNEIRTTAANASLMAYTPDTGPAEPILMATHRFVKNDEGAIEHYINNVLRATVPPEGWDDYAAQWPDCQPLVTALRQ